MTKKSIILFAVCCLSAFLSLMIYFFTDEKAEKAIPVLNTLSSEQLMGLGYTAALPADNSDIWEDDDFSYSDKSSDNETVSVSSPAFPIDINAATAEELTYIKGIGSATAENIISYRNSHGYFYSIDDLLGVDGIGSKKLAEIKDYIFIDPEIIAAVTETAVSEDNFTEESSVSSASNSPVFPIELNTASAEDLMNIDGIGETIAEAIAEYAHTVGFNDVSDLMNVPGIGEKRFENISSYVYVENPSSETN